MSTHTNHLGQPVGAPIENWRAAARPTTAAHTGHWCRLEPLDLSKHQSDLEASFTADREGRIYTYLTYDSFDAFVAWAKATIPSGDPFPYAIIDTSNGKALGVACLMRITPDAGAIEVGGICYGPPLQQTPAATEAMYLLMKYAFEDLGYRRYEWKCDSFNLPSRAAAERLGFSYEGLFRQALVYKNRNRDTAWFSIIDTEWPERKAAFEAWLSPENFGADGAQKKRLRDFQVEAAG